MELSPGEKLCPECREVYRRGVERCADCGVFLVHPSELEEAAAPSLPPASEMVPIRVAATGWCRLFSERLSSLGIPHRVDEVPGGDEGDDSVQRRSYDQGQAIYVLAGDRERALEADAAFVREQIPDLPAEGADASAGEDGCPACGDPLPDDASECPGCGLFVGGPA